VVDEGEGKEDLGHGPHGRVTQCRHERRDVSAAQREEGDAGQACVGLWWVGGSFFFFVRGAWGRVRGLRGARRSIDTFEHRTHVCTELATHVCIRGRTHRP
jgi:hypothetical protein